MKSGSAIGPRVRGGPSRAPAQPTSGFAASLAAAGEHAVLGILVVCTEHVLGVLGTLLLGFVGDFGELGALALGVVGVLGVLGALGLRVGGTSSRGGAAYTAKLQSLQLSCAIFVSRERRVSSCC